MSLNIKNPETELLVRQLAKETGENVTCAVTIAVSERLNRIHQEGDNSAAERARRMRAIAKDAAPRWIEPYRTGEHGNLLYDENGLPL